MSTDRDEWDEWGDEIEENAASSEAEVSRPEPLDSEHAEALDSADNVQEPTVSKPQKKPRVPLEWSWDLDELESDLQALAPSREPPVITAHPSDEEDELIARLASCTLPMRHRLQKFKTETQLIRGRSLVTKWNLLHLQHSTQAQSAHDNTAHLQIDEQLLALAGDWGSTPVSDTDMGQQLQEMSALLHSSLLACDSEDIGPFQQALEQLFASQPNSSLRVPVTWIRPAAPSSNDSGTTKPFDAFLQRLVDICDNETLDRVAVLTEAQRFQDAKDIQRDEVIVNGELLTGTIGYDAVIAGVEKHTYEAIAAVTSASGALQVKADAVRNVAKQLLHACNRTESGGASYEILSQFLSNHSTDVVLIRPASARAPPLQISMDVGPFRTQGGGWSFGVRVAVSAVTWYCICEASDPTVEYYEVETTYASRLAFPLGLAPLSTAATMRRDTATVTISIRPDTVQPATASDLGVPPLKASQLSDEADEDALL